MSTIKNNQSKDSFFTIDGIYSKFISILKYLPWNLIKGPGIVFIIVFILSLYTTLFCPSFWIFQSLSIKDSVELLKYSLPSNDTCFINYNDFIDFQKTNQSTLDYKKDIHVIILDELIASNNFLPEENKKYSFVFSSFHTIGSDKNKKIRNFLNGKINNDCIEENDESLLTQIFEKKGYQVRTFIDNTFIENILCSNNNNYIDTVKENPNNKFKYITKSKPSFSLTILSKSSNILKLKKLDTIVKNIMMYQNSSFENSYVILIKSNDVLFNKPHLVISLPLDKQAKEYDYTLSYNLDKSLTSNDLYKTLITSNENNTFINILTTNLSKRSCEEMKVPVENCRCQSYFFKVPKEMYKLNKILKKHFNRDLREYFNNQEDKIICTKKLEEKQDYIETYYTFITLQEGIHFRVIFKMNNNKKFMALYNDKFHMISQGIINIGETTKC